MRRELETPLERLYRTPRGDTLREMRRQLRVFWSDETLEFIQYGGRGVHTRTCTMVENRMRELATTDDPSSVHWPYFLTKEEAESRSEYHPCKWCEPDFKRKLPRPKPPPWDGMSAVRRALDEAARRQGISRWDVITRLAGEAWVDG